VAGTIKEEGISWLAEKLLASQEGLSSMELVIGQDNSHQNYTMSTNCHYHTYESCWRLGTWKIKTSSYNVSMTFTGNCKARLQTKYIPVHQKRLNVSNIASEIKAYQKTWLQRMSELKKYIIADIEIWNIIFSTRINHSILCRKYWKIFKQYI
jgi:hypothetical protein